MKRLLDTSAYVALRRGQPEVAAVVRESEELLFSMAAGLKRLGKPIPSNDIWIAAHTLETGAELVTLDAHFRHVAGLPIRTPE